MTQETRTDRTTAGAIIVAAGSSTRMGGVDKLLARLGDRPVVAHSIAAVASHPGIEQLVVVASGNNQQAITAVVAELAPRARVVLGGARRKDSVRAGLDAIESCEYVIVHDGARPLVTHAMIDAALEGAREAGAALCAIPVTDTVKRAEPSGRVSSTVTREGLWLAQTPQAFRTDLLRRAHQEIDLDVTDDAALIELLGEPVKLVMGSRLNLKITLQSDLPLAEALMNLQDATHT
jgi:2-C-methyl-D-erythritol 4-phosphate cytidylyltransferase